MRSTITHVTAWFSLLLMLSGGCAGVWHSVPDHPEAKEVIAFTEQIADTYHVPRISVMIAPHAQKQGGTYRLGMLTLGSWVLTAPTWTWQYLVAHEMGHYLLGHDRLPSTVTTGVDWLAVQPQREIEADLKAVEILIRVGKHSELNAIKIVFDYLDSHEQAVAAGRTVRPRGHGPTHEKKAAICAVHKVSPC